MDKMGSVGAPLTSQLYGEIKPVKLPDNSINVGMPMIEDGYAGNRDSDILTGGGIRCLAKMIDSAPLESAGSSSQDKVVSGPADEAPRMETFVPTKQEREVSAFEGFFLAGGMDAQPSFGNFSLNGPSALTNGIVTLGGVSVNNPTTLMQE